jgi:hypothetical protein
VDHLERALDNLLARGARLGMVVAFIGTVGRSRRS